MGTNNKEFGINSTRTDPLNITKKKHSMLGRMEVVKMQSKD